MPSIANLISKSIIDDAKIRLNPADTIARFDNSENEKDLKSILIDIKQNDDTILCFTFDIKERKKVLEVSVLKPKDWIRKKCDGIIYKFEDETHNFILIEIKTESSKHCKHQLNSMLAFMTYLIKIIEIEENLAIMRNVVFRKVLITSRATKERIRPNKGVAFNKKIDANEIQYGKIQSAIKMSNLLNCKEFRLCNQEFN